MLEEALNWISFHWSVFGCHWYSRENASKNLEKRKGYWKRNDIFSLSNGKVLAEEVQYCYSCSWFWWRCIRQQSIKKMNFFLKFIALLTTKSNLSPSKYSPPLLICRSQHFFRFRNMFCGMARRSRIEFSSISCTIWNWWPFNEDLNFRNRKKSAGSKSGEQGGCGTTFVSCFIKHSWIRSVAWAGALSWCSIQVLFVHAPGLFLRTAYFKRFRTFR